MLTDRRTNGQTNGKADTYVTKSGLREMFHARFDGCLVDENTNFDIMFERRHKC